jgi:hypothetical protein
VPARGRPQRARAKLEAAGRAITWDGPRFYVEDPFGNRLELLAPHAELSVRALRDDEREWAATVIGDSWGDVVIGGGREHRPAECRPSSPRPTASAPGLATYALDGADCELVTIDALTVGGGIAARWSRRSPRPPARRAPRGCTSSPPTTTSPPCASTSATASPSPPYAAGEIATTRRRKPQIPATGYAGIAIRDELVLERTL